MKPDWKDAPEWAQWLAIDRFGRWAWFLDEPKPQIDVPSDQSGIYFAGKIEHWDDVTPRPKTTDPDTRTGSEGKHDA